MIVVPWPRQSRADLSQTVLRYCVDNCKCSRRQLAVSRVSGVSVAYDIGDINRLVGSIELLALALALVCMSNRLIALKFNYDCFFK